MPFAVLTALKYVGELKKCPYSDNSVTSCNVLCCTNNFKGSFLLEVEICKPDFRIEMKLYSGHIFK